MTLSRNAKGLRTRHAGPCPYCYMSLNAAHHEIRPKGVKDARVNVAGRRPYSASWDALGTIDQGMRRARIPSVEHWWMQRPFPSLDAKIRGIAHATGYL